MFLRSQKGFHRPKTVAPALLRRASTGPSPQRKKGQILSLRRSAKSLSFSRDTNKSSSLHIKRGLQIMINIKLESGVLFGLTCLVTFASANNNKKRSTNIGPWPNPFKIKKYEITLVPYRRVSVQQGPGIAKSSVSHVYNRRSKPTRNHPAATLTSTIGLSRWTLKK